MSEPCKYCKVCTTPYYQNKIEIVGPGVLTTTSKEISKTQAFCKAMKQLKELKDANRT